MQSFNYIAPDRMFLVVQKRVGLRRRFSRPGSSRVVQRPKVRKNVVLLGSGYCLQDSLRAIARLGNEEVYAVVVTTFASQLHSGRITNIIAIQKVADIFKEKACDPSLG